MSGTIVFFGSGPVAAKSLELLAQKFTIEAVVTKPRPAHHKGSVPVIDITTKLHIPTHTVQNKSDLSTLIASAPFTSKLGVLIDFGIIVTQEVIDYFPRGIVNSHFSLLPEWRGADPITFAILSGQEKTGVSLMLLVEKMDEGPLVGYGEQPLDGSETISTLTNSLVQLSDALLAHDIPRLLSGTAKEAPQTVTGRAVSYSRKLSKEDGLLDWHKPAVQLEREVRAFLGWPGSRTTLAAKDVLITAAQVATRSGTPGEVIVESSVLMVYCGQDALVIERLKPAGKKEMTAQAFLAGHKHLL